MEKIFNSLQIKQIELTSAQRGFSHFNLMEEAGSCAFLYINNHFFKSEQQNITILLGKGNNAGDGLVIARKIYELRGHNVTIIMLDGEIKTVDAQLMLERIKKFSPKILKLGENEPGDIKKAIDQSDIIIDGVYGIGFRLPICPKIASIFRYINYNKKFVVALDTPSGAVCNSGQSDVDTLKANYTLSFTANKPLHHLQPSSEFCGKVTTLNIGIKTDILQNSECDYYKIDLNDLKKTFVSRNPNTNKGNYGKGTMFCGSYSMAGASILSLSACLRCGLGLARAVLPDSIYPIVATKLPEAVYLPLATLQNGELNLENNHFEKSMSIFKNSTGNLVGCGVSQSKSVEKFVWSILENATAPTVIDADGLNIISKNMIKFKQLAKAKGNFILTPHPLEMSRLTGLTVAQIESNRREVALNFAKEYGVTLLLKGHRTVIAFENGEVFLNTTGNAGMAKGGSGDVLSGIIVSLVAQNLPIKTSVVAGCYIHGMAGDLAKQKLGEISMLASDIVGELPNVFLQIENN